MLELMKTIVFGAPRNPVKKSDVLHYVMQESRRIRLMHERKEITAEQAAERIHALKKQRDVPATYKNAA